MGGRRSRRAFDFSAPEEAMKVQRLKQFRSGGAVDGVVSYPARLL